MSGLDTDLLSLSNELAKLGGSRNVKLGRLSVYIRGVNVDHTSSSTRDCNFLSYIEDSQQMVIRNPLSVNDMRCYNVTKYFQSSISNEQVSAELVPHICSSVFDGFNVNLITYGATKTGKSQLLFGSAKENNTRYDSCQGLLGTVCTNVWRTTQQSADTISISMSAFEIGNNKVRDLLQSSQTGKAEIEAPFQVSSVTVNDWKHMGRLWDIIRYNSSNWTTLNTGYDLLPNECHFFIQIKLFNQTQQTISTLNLVDLCGSQPLRRSLRTHISQEQIAQNKNKNVSLFSFNKLLHGLSHLHSPKPVPTQSSSTTTTTIENMSCHQGTDAIGSIIKESRLNSFVGPMMSQNAESMFLGFVSCHNAEYQASLRTIQILSRSLCIPVPCVHVSCTRRMYDELKIVPFERFAHDWQSVLQQHCVIEKCIQQNVTRQMKDFERTLATGSSDASQHNAQLSSLLDDILKTDDAETEVKDEGVANDLQIANFRLQICALNEKVRKLENESQHVNIFESYNQEIETLQKQLQNMADESRAHCVKHMNAKHELMRYKIGAQQIEELKTIHMLQKSVRDTTKKLKKTEAELLKLSADLRHREIRYRVLQNTKEQSDEMCNVLQRRESELTSAYLQQAQTQAFVDKLQFQMKEAKQDNATLIEQNKSLQNEVATLRSMCKQMNEDAKQKHYLHRVSKKWTPSKHT